MIKVNVTPKELACCFWDMASEDQALFFNELGAMTEGYLSSQLKAVSRDDGLTSLTPAGRRVMEKIGEYSQRTEFPSVKCIPVPGIANAYVIISGHSATTGNGVKKCMSFFYDNGDVGAEWEPDDGPITVIHSCGKDAKNAQRHWFYDYCTGYGEWGQLAVEEEGLPRVFILGDYEYLFAVLKNWAK